MLKWLAILAVLFTVVGSSPIPGETPNHESQATQKPEDKTHSGKNPAAPIPPVATKDCSSEQFKNDPDCKKAVDKEPSVTVSKFPTANVTIQSNPKRDRYDWLAYWAGIVLVLVGGIGVGFGWKTLRAIKRQADLTEKQDKTARDKERARLSIYGLDKPEFLAPTHFADAEGKSIPVLVSIFVVNDGNSIGFNVRAMGHLEIKSGIGEGVHKEGWYNLQIPGTIRNSDANNPTRVIVTRVPLETKSFDYIWVLEKFIDRIRDRSLHLGVSGEISYDDVFGTTHHTPFHFVWKLSGHGISGQWPDESQWFDFSDKSD